MKINFTYFYTMLKNIGFYILLFLVAFSCTEENQQHTNTHQVKVTEAKGYVVPKDSTRAPECTEKVRF